MKIFVGENRIEHASDLELELYDILKPVEWYNKIFYKSSYRLDPIHRNTQRQIPIEVDNLLITISINTGSHRMIFETIEDDGHDKIADDIYRIPQSDVDKAQKRLDRKTKLKSIIK